MKLNRTLGLLLIATATVGAGAAVAAAAVSTSAAASTAPSTASTAPAPGGKHWHHRHGGMLAGVTLRATRQLNLTSDQQAAIKGILSNARAQHKAAAAGSAGIDVVALGNPGDPNYAAALQNAKTAAANRFQSEVQLQGQIYNVLTADQKAKLPQVLADMKSKAEQRRAEWSQQQGTEAPGAGSN
jgi:Spy/CpxP family protein refolding chaperone